MNHLTCSACKWQGQTIRQLRAHWELEHGGVPKAVVLP